MENKKITKAQHMESIDIDLTKVYDKQVKEIREQSEQQKIKTIPEYASVVAAVERETSERRTVETGWQRGGINE
jgi:hypothetical protein